MKALPQEALNEIRAVVAEYLRLRGSTVDAKNANDAQIASISKALDATPQAVGWQDSATAHLCVIGLLPPDAVRARLISWRRRMREVIGEQRYTSYIAVAPSVSAGVADRDKLLADLAECIRAVFYFYGAYGIGARGRSDVSKLLFAAVIVVLALLAVLALLLSWKNAGGWVLYIQDWKIRLAIAYGLAMAAAGAVGSVVSVQRRLEDPNVAGDPFYGFIQTQYDGFGVAVVSPIFGAIFGLVTEMLLLSHLIDTKLVDLKTGYPTTINDGAALLVLGFLAGFAEQLIPDALSRVATRALGGLAGDPPVAASGGTAPQPPGGDNPPGKDAVGGSGTPTPGGAGDAVASRPVATMSPAPADVTPSAAAMGQDAALASEPSADDLAKGLV